MELIKALPPGKEVDGGLFARGRLESEGDVAGNYNAAVKYNKNITTKEIRKKLYT
jgi:hypothetical protein